MSSKIVYNFSNGILQVKFIFSSLALFGIFKDGGVISCPC